MSDASHLKSLEEASEWLVKMAEEGTLSKADQAQWEAWYAQPNNARTWKRAERLLGQMNGLPSEIAIPVLNRPADLRKRKALRNSFYLALLAPMGLASYQGTQHFNLLAQYRTNKGERETIELPDTSQVTLNTESAINTHFSDTTRHVDLLDGEIYLAVANKPTLAPLTLASKECQIASDNGTLCVRQYPGITRVSLLTGSATVITANNTHRFSLQAGEVATYSKEAQLGQARIGNIQAQKAWLSGMLAVNAMPMEDFAEELMRYQYGLIRVAPNKRKLLISGSFPVTDSRQLFAMLERSYHLNVEQNLAGFWVNIS